ncbi:hypothetical protein L9G15_05180 [Shewanella sp. A3A]|nr:hypothetical protein [Shewanella ferrihydritica]
MVDFQITVGEDNFGTYVEVEKYDDFDELEDILIEQYALESIGSLAIENNSYRIWFNNAVTDLSKLHAIVNGLKQTNS